MSRPALSALRALEIIDLMAGMPNQALTISEIVRLTGTNIASCHAILGVLVQRGYLLRHPIQKGYRLAPSIVAIGEAAAAHDPLLASARAAARSIAEQLNTEALLTARAGDDIIGVARFSQARHSAPSLRVGQRVPLAPPIGSLFFAWTPLEEAERWIAPENQVITPALREARVRALELARTRGFVASLATPEHDRFTDLLHQGGAQKDPGQLSGLLGQLDNGLYQPARIEPEAQYHVRMISAPVFDAHGQVLYSVAANFAREAFSGTELIRRAGIIVEATTASMQENSIGGFWHAARA